MTKSLFLRRPSTAFLAGWFFALLVFGGWSIASPVSSAPDEPSHAVKAEATVRGMFTGAPTDQVGIESFSLPRDISDLGGAMACTAAQPTTSALCQPDLGMFPSSEFAATSGVGSYNPVYYALVGWPSLFLEGDEAIIGMRLASALINGVFIGVMFWAAAQMTRGSSLVAWIAVALTPMATYLGGMINPNGVEITGCAALASVAWLIVHDRAASRLASRASMLAASGIVAGNARSASPLFVALIVVAVLLTVPLERVRELIRRRQVWIAAGVSVLGLGFAAVWTALVAAPAGFIPSSDPARDGIAQAVVHTLGATENYGTEMIGVLGWFDTGLPQPVYFGWTAGIGFLVIGALAFARRRFLLASVVLMIALLLVPSLLQAPSAATYGYIWQGRYSLPVFVGMVIVAGLGWQHSRRPDERWSRPVTIVVAAAAVAQIVSFATAYRRFSVGVARPFRDVLTGDAWQAPGGLVFVTGLFVVGAVGLAITGISISQALERTPADDLWSDEPSGGLSARLEHAAPAHRQDSVESPVVRAAERPPS
ncbi:DUF2142 domain-containing protein [Frigoribacterium sp. 2-23]|uniref:DUF2142 domain-containing protein n=1 Tax=Frigoribacterium sp. 2-23 TaxID=3415006 RepID=UPI003C7049D4